MKILIAPQADNASCSLLARSLISTLSSKDISVAVCHTHSLSRKVPLYPCRSPKRPLFNFGAENRSHEEWMYSRGQMHSGYVLEDTETLLDAIQDYKPDALLCLDRPSALIASRIASIPCIAFVHPAMYRKALFPTHCMHGLNRTLSYYHLDKGYLLSFNFNKNKQSGMKTIQVNGKTVIEAVV